MGLGFNELVIILIIVVIIFGATRLPQLGRGLGEGIKNFKESIRSSSDEADSEEPEKRKKSA